MEKPRFVIKPRRYTGESTVVSLRMPKEMLRDIDAVAAHVGRTRNEFLMMSLEFALEHLEIDEDERG